MSSQEREAKVYVNGSLVGTHPDPHELAEQIREARRIGDVSEMVNVSVKDRTREVIVNADAGRARRPLLVVEDGEPRISDQEIEALQDGDLEFEDLVDHGYIWGCPRPTTASGRTRASTCCITRSSRW